MGNIIYKTNNDNINSSDNTNMDINENKSNTQNSDIDNMNIINSDINVNDVNDKNSRLHLISEGKIDLLNAIIDVSKYNAILDKKRNDQSNVIIHEIIELQKKTIEELILQNTMLRKSLDEYKTFYHELEKKEDMEYVD